MPHHAVVRVNTYQGTNKYHHKPRSAPRLAGDDDDRYRHQSPAKPLRALLLPIGCRHRPGSRVPRVWIGEFGGEPCFDCSIAAARVAAGSVVHDSQCRLCWCVLCRVVQDRAVLQFAVCKVDSTSVAACCPARSHVLDGSSLRRGLRDNAVRSRASCASTSGSTASSCRRASWASTCRRHSHAHNYAGLPRAWRREVTTP